MNVPDWFDQLSEGIILIEDDRVVAFNARAAELLDVDKDMAIGSHLIGVLRDHRLEQVYMTKKAAECRTRGRVLFASPIQDGLVLQDRTRLRQSEDDAKELLAVLSHELRTPASIMRSTFEALKGDIPDTLRHKFLERAEAEGERLVRLLEDLTVDVKPPQNRQLLLREVVARSSSLVQRKLSEQGVRLVKQVEDITVWADADKLTQVLINLLENAAVHGPSQASIYLLANADKLGFAHIAVQDQGEPIEQSLIPRLFAPHSRGEPAKAKGTGLGLYIVQNIVKAWGGDVWGKARAEGNEFGFTVPLAPRRFNN